MGKLWFTNFDDTPVREFGIEFFQKVYNIKLISNQEKYGIDLLYGDEFNNIIRELGGVELEHGKWSGNYWESETYSTLSNLGFKTLNVPIRKEKYWLNEVKGQPNPYATKNIFFRSNKDFTQVIIIRPETFRDPNKVYKTKFQPNNSKELEEWLCFKEEDVETYNLVDGKWILNKK